MRQPLLALAILFLPCIRCQIGIQSNEKGLGSSFASSMAYDSEMGRLYITGATNGPFFDQSRTTQTQINGCFLGILQLPFREGETEAKWLKRERIGDDSVESACSDIHIRRRQNKQRQIFVTGHTTIDEKVYGYVHDLNWAAETQATYWMQEDAVQYPVSLAHLEGESDLIIASIQSETKELQPAYEQWKQTQQGLDLDTTTTGGYLPPRFGTSFATVANRISFEEKNETNTIVQTAKWQKEYASAGDSVQISMVEWISANLVIVGGSTKARIMFSETGPIKEDDSMTGFLISLNPKTSDVLKHQYIDSALSPSKILGTCHHVESGEVSLYAVGMTKRQNSLAYDAFVMKLNAFTLEKQWVTRFNATGTTEVDSAPAHVHALSCQVDESGNFLYVGGNVLNNGKVRTSFAGASTASYGSDDVFCAKIKSSDGAVGFIKQIGTAESDTMANGRSLSLDKDGNVLLLLNTRGSFFRLRPTNSRSSEVVVLSVDSITGNYLDAVTASTSTPTVSPTEDVSEAAGEPNDSLASDDDSSSSLTDPRDVFLPDEVVDGDVWLNETIYSIKKNISVDENVEKKDLVFDEDRTKGSSDDHKRIPKNDTDEGKAVSRPTPSPNNEKIKMGGILGFLATFNVVLIAVLVFLHVARRRREKDEESLEDEVIEEASESHNEFGSIASYNDSSTITSFGVYQYEKESPRTMSFDAVSEFTRGWWSGKKHDQDHPKVYMEDISEDESASEESESLISDNNRAPVEDDSSRIDDPLMPIESTPSVDSSNLSYLTRGDLS